MLSDTPSRHFVSADTDICIEGFPRSGNSWAVTAFESWNPQARVAHHVHAPAQVKRAVAMGIPAAVLIRDPLQAVSSYLVYRSGEINARGAVAAYLAFYEPIEHLRERVSICSFEEFAERPDRMVEAVNARYGTGFAAGLPDETFREDVMRQIRARTEVESLVSAPTATREASKAEAAEAVSGERRFAAARRLYERLTGGGS